MSAALASFFRMDSISTSYNAPLDASLVAELQTVGWDIRRKYLLCRRLKAVTRLHYSGPLGLIQFHHSRSPDPSVESPYGFNRRLKPNPGFGGKNDFCDASKGQKWTLPLLAFVLPACYQSAHAHVSVNDRVTCYLNDHLLVTRSVLPNAHVS